MLRYLRVLVQHEEVVALSSGAGGSALRDKSMAENAVWLANVAHRARSSCSGRTTITSAPRSRRRWARGCAARSRARGW